MGGNEQKSGPPHLHDNHSPLRPVPQRHGFAQLCPEPGMNPFTKITNYVGLYV